MTNSRARAGPARSAIRWTPPPNGVSPTTRSTSPNLAPSAAQIMSQPSAGLEARGQAEPVDEREGRDLEPLERLQLAGCPSAASRDPSSPPETSAKTLRRRRRP